MRNSQVSFTLRIEILSNRETTDLGKDVWILPELKNVHGQPFQALSPNCVLSHIFLSIKSAYASQYGLV